MVWCAEGHQIIYNAYDSLQKFFQKRCIEFLSPITQYYKSVDLHLCKEKNHLYLDFPLIYISPAEFNKNYRKNKRYI